MTWMLSGDTQPAWENGVAGISWSLVIRTNVVNAMMLVTTQEHALQGTKNRRPTIQVQAKPPGVVEVVLVVEGVGVVVRVVEEVGVAVLVLAGVGVVVLVAEEVEVVLVEVSVEMVEVSVVMVEEEVAVSSVHVVLDFF